MDDFGKIQDAPFKLQKKKIGVIVRVAVSVILVAVLIRMIDWVKIKESLVGFRMEWLVVAGALVIAAVAVSAIKWQMVFKAQGKDISLGRLWNIYWVGLFYNNFLPSSIGGDGVRIFLTSKIIDDGPAAATSVVVERVFATVAIGVVGMAGMLGCMLTRDVSMMVFALFAGIIILCTGILSVLFMKKVPRILETDESRIKKFVVGMMAHGSKISENRGYVVKSLAWSIVFQMVMVIINCALFAGMGIRGVGLVDAMYLVPAASVASMIPLGINGYGLREGAYVALLASYGIGAEKAFTVSVLFAFLVSAASIYGAFLQFFRKDRLE